MKADPSDRSHRLPQCLTMIICTASASFYTACDATRHTETEPQPLRNISTSPIPRFEPREALIKFKREVSEERIVSILMDNHADIVTAIQPGRLYHVRILNDQSVESAISRLTSYEEIEYAEPNYRYETKK